MMVIKSGGGLNRPGETPNNPVKRTAGRAGFALNRGQAPLTRARL
jgi:hypothetical protein